MHRDHRKLCIIDSSIAYVGSMNISSTHLRNAQLIPGWRDTGVRVTGKPVAELARVFLDSWIPELKGTEDGRPPIDGTPVIAAQSERLKRQLYQELIESLTQAKQRIWITTAYFVPTVRILLELTRASQRGVDVVILTTRTSDAPPVRWMRSLFYRKLIRAGVRIFEYTPNILHAKSALIDERAQVGSSNLNHRSLFYDRELDVTLSLPKTVEQLSTQFILDLASSHRVVQGEWSQRLWADQPLARFAQLFRTWL